MPQIEPINELIARLWNEKQVSVVSNGRNCSATLSCENSIFDVSLIDQEASRAIGFIMVYKNKGRASATAGGATGGTGTSGTGGPTGGTATGDAGEAERQRQEEERLRQEEERRRRGAGTGGTRTGDFSAKFKEKPPDEHRQNVEQWENIKHSYQSGRINLFRMLIDNFPNLFNNKGANRRCSFDNRNP